ncbi:MAG: SDR family NAD(P)-dependent oxidoreductase [Proteobacteria bacterium]|nr:SDR family NAD(P)-dependent oxidoreductase [Pseudomonadota bacterium]
MATSQRRLAGRIALITGASRGIGAAISRRFAAEGAHVLLAARTVGGLEEVDDAIRAASGEQTQATLIPIDLKCAEDIEKLAAAVAQRFGKLDILVGNAAILGDLTPVSQIDPKTWDEVIETNLTANWNLIRTLEPLLLSSDSGRAIFVTSGVSGGRAYWGGYAVTKTALEALVRTWAQEVEQTRLRINIVNPGAVRTSMRAKAYPGEDPMTLPPPKDITDIFVDLADEQCDRHGDTVSAQ